MKGQVTGFTSGGVTTHKTSNESKDLKNTRTFYRVVFKK